MESVKLALANKITKFMHDNEYTKSGVSKQAGICRSHLSLICNGKHHRFSLEYLLDVCSKLLIPVSIECENGKFSTK